MTAPSPQITRPQPPTQEDQRIRLHSVSWEAFEKILDIRGDQAGVRIAYLAGELELMSPSVGHEATKTLIARLLEAYAEERDLDLNGYGSWTLKEAAVARGLEPDECYVLGAHPPDLPDLAIEVNWTSGGIDKLEIYRGLRINEVWMWQQGRIQVYRLQGDGYEANKRSVLLPDLDLDLLTSFLDRPNQTRATKAYRAALRASQQGLAEGA